MLKAFKKNSKIICYVLAFIIPIIFMLIVSSAMEFSPFSWRAPLVGDTVAQFYPFYSYLKTIIFNNNDLFYTFSKTIGGDMAGFAFYYIGNPILYILGLLPSAYLPAGILFIIILLMALSSLNFNIMVNNMWGFRWSSLLFSISYAFIGYYTSYFSAIIFFNNIMLLPIIILGLYEITIREKISLKYSLFLGLSIISNYYMGYMTCIFCGLFFIYLFVINKIDLSNIKKNLNVIITFIWQTVLALLLSSVALLTVVYSLSSSQKGDDGFLLKLTGGTNFRITDVFTGFYSISFNGNISDGLPIIYCGTLTVVFLILFYLNKEIKLKEKIASAIMILIFVLSFTIKFINRIWHGMAEPVGFPYRYSYLFCFFILLLAYRAFIYMKQGTRKYHTLIVFGIFILYSLYLMITNSSYVGTLQIILTGAFLCMYLAGVYAICYKREYMYPVTIGFFVIMSFDLLLSSHYSIFRYYKVDGDSEYTSSVEYYDNYYQELNEIYKCTELDNQDKGFYRFDKTYRSTNNDSMLVGYNGLSHFSSTESTDVLNFMEKLGFCANNMWAYYGEDGNTAFVESLLAQKYMASQYDETGKPYDFIKKINEKYLFKNPYSLDLAFPATDIISDIDLDKYNHFTIQNEIAKGITGNTYGIYRPVEVIDVKLENVEKYEKTYTVIDPEEDAYIEYELNVTSPDFIYMYFSAPQNQQTKIFVDGLQKSDYFTTYGWSTRCAGYFNENRIVPVRIYLNESEIEIDNYEFYYENVEELERFYEDVSKNELVTKEISSSNLYIEANIEEGIDKIALSVPYDEGWTIKVDGKEVEQEKILACLTSINITPGKHVIEMKYIPKGFILGFIISISALIILISIFIVERNRLNKLLKGE